MSCGPANRLFTRPVFAPTYRAGWKKVPQWLILLTLLVSGNLLSAQEMAHRQLSIREGLPGSAVYQVLKDHQGFLWFATNQGVARFDGSQFRYFTKEEGLPDNEVIKLYEDKHHNIWFITLLGLPAVYCQGAIRKFDCPGVLAITEDPLTDSIYLIAGRLDNSIHHFGYYRSRNTSGQWQFTSILRRMTINNTSVKEWPILRASLPSGTTYHFSFIDLHIVRVTIRQSALTRSLLISGKATESQHLPFTRSSFFCPTADKQGIVLVFSDSLYYANNQNVHALLSLNSLGLNINLDVDVNSLFCENDSTLWVCTRNRGLIKMTHFMRPDRTVQYFFPNAFCTSIVKDTENGYWIGTLNEGVYYLPGQDFFHLENVPALRGKEVKCVRRLDQQRLGVGMADGSIAVITQNPFQATVAEAWAVKHKNNRILDLWPSGQSLLVGTDKGVFRLQGRLWESLEAIHVMGGVKGIQPLPDGNILVGYGSGIRLEDRRKDTSIPLFSARATCVAAVNNRYYWGTLQGLYTWADSAALSLGGQYPALAGTINHIDAGPDSSLWISTQEGIVVLKNDRTHTIRKEQGLVSQLCRHALVSDTTAWISTDKGIARIDYWWQRDSLVYRLSAITAEDGLLSNDVNQVAIGGNYLWAATSKGMAFFSKDYVSSPTASPAMYISRMQVGQREIPVSDTVRIDYPNRSFRMALSAIAFRSGKQLYYEYRLGGDDSGWQRLLNNTIELVTLPFGELTLELRSIDRWGQVSNYPRPIVIINKPPFWKAGWFQLSLYLLSIFLLGTGFYFSNRNRQRKREVGLQLTKKMNELEMQALRSQMNPHFIFNCLSSIQRYILQSDVDKANLYLHKFSALIRKILHYSSHPTIRLEEEINMLELYLALEKMRIGDRMHYRIIKSGSVNAGDLHIPCMIIQPYVENAVKHGMAPLRDRQGHIEVRFETSPGFLECYIEDNGPGIDVSTGPHTHAGNEYASKGTSITGGRIHLMNSMQRHKIKLEIINRQQINPATTGTIVHLSFPNLTE